MLRRKLPIRVLSVGSVFEIGWSIEEMADKGAGRYNPRRQTLSASALATASAKDSRTALKESSSRIVSAISLLSISLTLTASDLLTTSKRQHTSPKFRERGACPAAIAEGA